MMRWLVMRLVWRLRFLCVRCFSVLVRMSMCWCVWCTILLVMAGR